MELLFLFMHFIQMLLTIFNYHILKTYLLPLLDGSYDYNPDPEYLELNSFSLWFCKIISSKCLETKNSINLIEVIINFVLLSN